MIDVQLLRTQLDEVVAGLATRGAPFDRDGFLALEAERKTIQTRTQELQSARNAHAKQIGQAKSRGEDPAVLLAEAGGINRELGELEARLADAQRRLRDFLAGVPNLPHASVPRGRGEADNVEQRRWGAPRAFDFAVKDHVDLGEGLGQLDFALGSKIAGSRFVLMRGAGWFWCIRSSSATLSEQNGLLPVSISNSSTPNAQMSARLSTFSPLACSGDM